MRVCQLVELFFLKVLRLPGFDDLGSSGCASAVSPFSIYRYGRSAEPDSVLFLHSTTVSPPFCIVSNKMTERIDSLPQVELEGFLLFRLIKEGGLTL